MRKFNVTGMSCAACSARVEKAVNDLDGIEVCSVNLLTNSMTVEGSSADLQIIDAVRKAGYDASVYSFEKAENRTENRQIAQLIFSAILLLVLMYFSMGYVMWNSPVGKFLENNGFAVGVTEFILSLIILIINRRFFVNGLKGVIHLAPNMDTLVAMGAGVSFLYSTYLLCKMPFTDGINLHMYLHNLYFESAAMIVTLISVGKLLESYTKGKTTSAVESLIDLTPKFTTVIRNGKELKIPTAEIVRGDIFIVRAGESVAADGTVIEGSTSIDESALTGESIPIDKCAESRVYAGTNNINGYIKCIATEASEDSVLSKIIKLVNDTSAGKAPIARIADRVSAVFVPAVTVIALLTFAVWLAFGQTVGYALSHGIAVLVISCPCALGLATPVAIMVGNGVAAKNGILFKTATALEQTGKAKNIIFDKTGTVTAGRPLLKDIVTFEYDNDELLKTAFSLERQSMHPLALAVCSEAISRNITPYGVENFKEVSGKGIYGVIDGCEYFAGNLQTACDMSKMSENELERISKVTGEGKTPIILVKDKKAIGFMTFADAIKPDSIFAVEMLKKMNIDVSMLTGDNEATARSVADRVHIENVKWGVMPDEKSEAVEKSMNNGFTVMVGDGINDAPALTRADIGIALGAGTDIAIDSADVILIQSGMTDVVNAIRISRATLRNIKENLFWAFIYNIIGIPIAAGVFAPLGLELSPMFAAAAMSLSSFCVVINALRLNLFKIISYKSEREDKVMKKTVIIEGMMCEHCSARIKSALLALENVKSVDVELKQKTAIMDISADIDDTVISAAIENQGYKVTEIK